MIDSIRSIAPRPAADRGPRDDGQPDHQRHADPAAPPRRAGARCATSPSSSSAWSRSCCATSRRCSSCPYRTALDDIDGRAATRSRKGVADHAGARRRQPRPRPLRAIPTASTRTAADRPAPRLRRRHPLLLRRAAGPARGADRAAARCSAGSDNPRLVQDPPPYRPSPILRGPATSRSRWTGCIRLGGRLDQLLDAGRAAAAAASSRRSRPPARRAARRLSAKARRCVGDAEEDDAGDGDAERVADLLHRGHRARGGAGAGAGRSGSTVDGQRREAQADAGADQQQPGREHGDRAAAPISAVAARAAQPGRQRRAAGGHDGAAVARGQPAPGPRRRRRRRRGS